MGDSTDPSPADKGTPFVNPREQERLARARAPLPGSPPQFQPGDPVPNRPLWTLVRKLGRGGFGEVWQAEHELEKRLGAVKFCVHPHARELLATHEKKVIVHAMKQAEHHPNIVPLWDYDLSGETPWLLYEFVPGGRTLADAILEWRDLPMEERLGRTLQTLHTIARALARFHELARPLVHRDLKPDNVLMAVTTPRITDFGIGGAAVEAAHSDSTGTFPEASVRLPTMLKTSGNQRYASPEQLAGRPPHPRNDVYTLGILAYQMLVGRVDAEVKGNWQRRLKGDGVPDPFIELIGNSVSDEPEDRPKDAREWETALWAWLPGAQNTALRTPFPEKVGIAVEGSWCSRPRGNVEAEWVEVTSTPADVSIEPDQEYRLSIDSNAGDERFESIGGLSGCPALHSLGVSGCKQLTDAGLRHLRGFTALRALGLSGCEQLTDAGLSHLSGLIALESLSLSGCRQLTEAGLSHLNSLTGLRSLHLSGCARLTDAALARLMFLSALQALDLSYCGQLTDAGLAHLKEFPALQALGLSGCARLTDGALGHLRRLTALRSLDLSWCGQLTDAGLMLLKALAALRELDLSQCETVTHAGVATLQSALPNCLIRR
jgi:serine/threonine protein kinase